MPSAGFSIIHLVHNCSLGKNASRLVLWELGKAADADGTCFYLLETLAKQTRLSLKSVERALDELVDQGVLECFIDTKGRDAYRLVITRLAELQLAQPKRSPNSRRKRSKHHLRCEKLADQGGGPLPEMKAGAQEASAVASLEGDDQETEELDFPFKLSPPASSILNPPGQRQQHTISPDEQSFADLLARWSRTPEVPGDAFMARQIRPLLAVTTIEEWEEVIGWVFRYSKNVESWKYPPAVFVAKAENFLRTYRNRIVGNLKNLYREEDLSMGRASEGLG